MGNSIRDSGPDNAVRGATVSHYFTAKSWIEGSALQQLADLAELPGMLSIAGFPDLHPGKYGPVGMAALSTRLYPQLIGNDIGCGMGFFELDLPLRKFKIDKAADAMRQLETPALDQPEGAAAGDARSLVATANPFGTIGGGNHFCEIQAVEDLLCPEASVHLDRQKIYLLVHSGSRNLGANVFAETLAATPSLADGLDSMSDAGIGWLRLHDLCVEWAAINRQVIADRVAALLRADVRLIADIPHNLVRATAEGFVHYKGAAAVKQGSIAPIAGSRASLSYVVEPLAGAASSHWAISHGAGRKYDRRNMHGRTGNTRSEREGLLRNTWGGIAICDDRRLAVEEAAGAYKNAAQVVEDLAGHGLIRALAAMKPLVTYKKVEVDHDEAKRDKGRERRLERRQKRG
ncbi:RNA ligase RtcB family protein [Pararhizobium sp. BT-229]|uniref:RNA ligase RtcB family protein n=1 Tax=Pararhizobium sp. BT-229 TaxID=2986923 RepID=UPI0021F6ACE9|nr:RNA ligase RtcB family protein [Pararhizobium sp. BT-229]MCV9961308.1 RNA ligase RtcB family protein [Pararhizobium sp. BT-229]